MVKTIAILSLSSGIMGENFIKYELDIGLKRLNDYGIKVKFMPNALKGMDYLKNHPEERAKDLISAFNDKEVDMILCAIGGDDTYKLLPYLFENDELKNNVTNKIFLGFSDTTTNHFMLNKVGLNSFYGQAFLPDVCELESEMLPYSKHYFEELINTGTIKEIKPSELWYESRTEFSEDQIGKPLISHKNQGFELIQGKDNFSGKILGGCLDTIYDFFDNTRHIDSIELYKKYSIFPKPEEWKDKILLLETSEEQMSPEKYEKALNYLKETGVFNSVNGVIVGKPMDEKYYDEYKNIILKVINNKSLPIVYNINIGHALPRCIIPFGVKANVSVKNQSIMFD